MNVKCIPVREMFHDEVQEYRILACELLESDVKIELNKYGNFSLSGKNLEELQLDQEANIVISPDSKSKYPGSYIMLGYQGIGFNEGKIEIDPAFEVEILGRLMGMNQARYVNEAYPNFVHMVLNGQEDEIDYHNIFNVGKKRLPDYIDKVKRDCHSILFYPTCYQKGIESQGAISRLAEAYKTPEGLEQEMSIHPYMIYMDVAGYSFDRADRLVKAHYPNMLDSVERCERATIKVLKENEETGDTRLSVRILVEELKELVPETKDHIKEVITDNPLFFYDEERKRVALMATYMAECTIADHIKHRLADKRIAPKMNWRDYTEVDGFTCTEEQSKILQMVADGARIALLTGSAGCVDCDTEFFTGHGWKRIADYEQGDKVLQYNMDGTAELVEPLRYIKQPCDKLWHFETSYGCNQTVCEDHRIVYWSAKGYYHECNIKDIIKKQSLNATGWTGKFKTTFSYGGNGIDLTDAEIKVMCAVICDSSFTKSNNNYCRFHIKKDRKKYRLREIFTEANIEWKESESSAEGYTDFYIYAPRREKEFTDYWYNCNIHQLQVICDNILFWDGNVNTTKTGKVRRRFSTNVKATADFIQFAYTACGHRATISVKDRIGQEYLTCGKLYTRKSIEYNLCISDRNFVGFSCKSQDEHNRTPITQVPTTDGYKYCFTVPSSMLVLRRRNCIFITGNCGKTSSMRALIRMLEAHGKTYQLLAPTGIAARRLNEATDRPASTIHMALAMGIPKTEYIILEESSMIAVHLLASLLNDIGYNPNLVFICDEAQLASISCGNIVQDIIDSGVMPHANLTKVFRYGTSGLATVATDTRNGKIEHLFDKYPDFKCVESDGSMEQIVLEYENLLRQGYKKNDILILSPFNKGDKGTYVINQRIQKEFNNHEYTPVEYKHPLGKIQFKIGDKVLNTKNNYSMPCIHIDEDGYESERKMFCANGDIGIVRDYRKLNDSRNALVVEFDNGMALVSGKDIGHLILGYAVSCHKAQGLGYKAVLVVIAPQHKRMLSRNLCYVALSRAQERMTLISDQDTIYEALKIQENLERDTYLADLLKEDNDD